MAPTQLTTEILNAAIYGLEEQKRKIDAQLAELRVMISNGTQAAPPSEGNGHGRISDAGRKAIAEAQRKRWAAAKGQSESKPASKPKRRLSAAGRAAIVAALKKRWATKKAAARPAKHAA